MNEIVLISGGTGMVGQKLTQLLVEQGYKVRLLSRKKQNHEHAEVFQWDVESGKMDEKALEGVHHLVHLAGAGIADRPWTAKRRQEIIDSRVKSAQILLKAIENLEEKPLSFISASAVGFYGDSKEQTFRETDAASDCFLGKTCQLWESASKKIKKMGVRRVVLRIGIVLSGEGGALPKMAGPVKFGAGAYFGNGQQWYSWIHVDDLVRMFAFAIQQSKLEGIYNAVAEEPVNNKDLTRAIAKQLGRPFIGIPTPAFVLRLAMGEMSNIVLYSTKVSAEKILSTGFKFEHSTIESALNAVYPSK